MRVLHVLNELKPSGAETMLLTAASALKESGMVCEILTTGAKVGAFAHRLAEAGYLIHHIPFNKSPLFFTAVYRLMAGNYQVIHLHSERANFWSGLVSRAAVHGVVLRTIHSNFEFEGNLRWRRGLQRRILARLGVQHVAISESVQRNELQRFGLTTVLVPNWYDSCRFTMTTLVERQKARAAMNIPLEEQVIVSVGNCSPVKNHSAIIEALALLEPERRPIYLHVGMEEAEHPERNLACNLGVGDRVRFLGPLDDIRPALHAADVFVMPSLYEGFGIAATEAMAAALPAILTDVPGLRDFRKITDGAIYASPNATSISQAIKNILSMPNSERMLLGKRAARDIQHNYSIDIGLGRYVEIYRGNAK